MKDENNTKLNRTQYDLLMRCAATKDMNAWNEWRNKHRESSIHLVGANFENANLEKAELEGADLRAANLQRAILTGANLKGTNLKGALLFKADLRKADCQGCSLYGADLNGVNLEGANLLYADLTQADLRGAKLSGLRLDSKAVLNDLARPLSGKQIASAVFVGTRLPGNKVTVIRENRYRTNPADLHNGAPPEHLKDTEAPASSQNIGVADHARDSKSPANHKNGATIVRSIMFDRDNIQAGLRILNYFGEILRQKYQGNDTKVIIEQEGLNVQLAVETGEREKIVIEKVLENYVAVVTGRQQMSAFLPDPLIGIALKKNLDLIHLELDQNESLSSSSSDANRRRLHKLLSDNICISRL